MLKKDFMNKCFAESVESETKLKMEVEILNHKTDEETEESKLIKKSETSSRRGRPKKEVKEEVKEEKFEGLSN